MAKRPPLCVRLYFAPHLSELVLRIGYQALPVSETRDKLAPLVTKYGKEKINAAIKEVLVVDPSQQPPLARLTEVARRAAWQLLGPPQASVTDLAARAPETEPEHGGEMHPAAGRKN
jgi:hypothetical protein